MLTQKEIKERAINAGYQVEDEGGNSFTVAEPHMHWTTPRESVIFTKSDIASFPIGASTAKFERKLLKDIDYHHENAKRR